MSSYSQSFVDLTRAALEMCGVQEGETVAVLAQGDQRADYARTFMDAAQKLGATSYLVTLPEVSSSLDGSFGAWTVGATPLARNRPVIEALKEADLLIDLMFLLFSKEQLEIQAAGTRVLLCIEPVDLLQRLFPTQEIRERVEAGEQLLRQAKTLRFTNEAGTDVTYQLGHYPVMTQYGHTDTAGRWDHWPSGFVFTGGADDGVDGKVVIAPGDILLPHKSYVQSAIELTIEQGRIVDIRGPSTPTCCATTWPRSTTSALTASRTSAGASTTGRAGRRWRPTPAAWAWRFARSTATCSSRRGPTASSAGRTTPPATSTSRCATAASSSTTSRSCSTETSSLPR